MIENNSNDIGRAIELTWFNTILNYAQVIGQEDREKQFKQLNERLESIEKKLDLILEENPNEH